MSLIVATATPHSFLSAIKAGIDAKSIETWSYDKDGDFTHVTRDNQWKGKAYLKPEVGDGKLTFSILMIDKAQPDEVYAVYHGRFTEMLLAHFKDKMTTIQVTVR